MNKSRTISNEVAVHKPRWYSVAARVLVAAAMVVGALGAGLAPANAAVTQQTMSDSMGNSGSITYLGMGKGTMSTPPSSYSTSPMFTATASETITIYSQYRVTNNGLVPTSAWSFFNPVSIVNGVSTAGTIVATSSPSYSNGILPVGASVTFTVRNNSNYQYSDAVAGTRYGVESSSTFCWANSNQPAGDCRGFITAGGDGMFIAVAPTTSVTPIAPTVAASNECGVGATVTIPAQAGVTYTNSNPSATEGTVTITATPQSGYTFPNGAVRSWTLDLGTIVPCDEEVTPLAPTVAASNECGVGATVTIPTVEGVTYTNSNPSATSGLVTITATADAGYVIADGAVTSWELDLGEIEVCDEVVTPIAPTATASSECGVAGTYNVPVQTGVVYTVSNPSATEGIITVTAAPAAGYTFPVNAVVSWELDLGQIEVCDEVVTPITPVVDVSEICGVGSTVIITPTTGITYSNSNPAATEGVVTITASANAGYEIAADAVTSWALDLGEIEACDEVVTPIAPAVSTSDVCGIGSEVLITPTTGVTYTNSNPAATEGVITITATANAGYEFAANAITSWELDLGQIEECEDTVTPVTPRITLSSNATNGNCYVIEVDDVEGVDYIISNVVNSEGKTIVTATPKDGYLFSDGAVIEWAFNLACEDKPVVPTKPVTPAANNGSGEKLAETGADGNILPLVGGGALILLIAGAGVLLARKRVAVSETADKE